MATDTCRMRIRPYTAEDWDELISIYPAIWQDDVWEDVDEDVARDYLGTVLGYDSSCALVAEDDGAIVGLIIAYDAKERDLPADVDDLLESSGDAVYLDELGVAPEHQHHHIGTRLLEKMLDRLQDSYDICILRAHPEVTDAIALYRHHGFRNTGIHDTDHPERIYMVKEFSHSS